jgi:hypothetical protein
LCYHFLKILCKVKKLIRKLTFFKKLKVVFQKHIFLYYICPSSGGLAHLARVLAWQARGDRFESDILHQ